MVIGAALEPKALLGATSRTAGFVLAGRLAFAGAGDCAARAEKIPSIPTSAVKDATEKILPFRKQVTKASAS
jgi:hypothetical protein